MGEGDAQLVVSVLGPQIAEIARSVEGSRRDREIQINGLRQRMDEQSKILHGRITKNEERLRKLELSHARRLGICGKEVTTEDIEDAEIVESVIGGIEFSDKHKKITGVAALVLLVLVGVCLFKWGPILVHALR